MSVIMKRSCNSNVTVKEDSITFNSFVLKIDGLRFEEFKTIANHVRFEEEKGYVDIAGHFDMMNAQGIRIIGWVASQTDLASDMWEVVE